MSDWDLEGFLWRLALIAGLSAFFLILYGYAQLKERMTTEVPEDVLGPANVDPVTAGPAFVPGRVEVNPDETLREVAANVALPVVKVEIKPGDTNGPNMIRVFGINAHAGMTLEISPTGVVTLRYEKPGP